MASYGVLNPSVSALSESSFTEIVSRSRLYSDIDISFTVHPIKGSVRILKEVEAVKRALRNLLFTEPTEKPFNMSYGTPINSLLFNLSDLNAFDIEDTIRNSIERYEPRVSVSSINVSIRPDQNAIDISIVFNILNMEMPYEVDVVIRRLK